MPTLFYTLQLLYAETRKLPIRAVSGKPSSVKVVNTSYSINFGLITNSEQYAIFRTILSLAGDVYNLLIPLRNLSSSQLQDLESDVKALHDAARVYGELRNVFTHLGEVLTNMQRHGVSGPLTTNCNIQYGPAAVGCVHIIWDADTETIHHVYQNHPGEVKFDKGAFQPLFDYGKNIYAKLINYDVGKHVSEYPSSTSMFPP